MVLVEATITNDLSGGAGKYFHETEAFKEIWLLVERLPVTSESARLLVGLLSKSQRTRIPDWNFKPPTSDLVALVNRWRPGGIHSGRLDEFAEVRMWVATWLETNVLTQHLESEDVAMRAAAYRVLRLTIRQMRRCRAKDGHYFCRYAIFNSIMWADPKRRRYLHHCVSDSEYRKYEAEWRLAEPNWFGESTDPSVTVGSVHELVTVALFALGLILALLIFNGPKAK